MENLEKTNLPAEDIVNIEIEDEVKKSYLDYAMSVIVGRSIPDIRDGLKPVQRRILFGMFKMGNLHNKSYLKSARIVGDVMGKYHPHGDQAIYDALVRMAQDFSLRDTLVDGQGNFGSIDGDAAAAMRYTEVRMESLAEELLNDIDKETVLFLPNYDNSLDEPEVLPASFPNLLVNGAAGIAVGMATNIPPHNLGEIIEGTKYLIKHPDASIEKLMQFIEGPDFPGGAIINGLRGINQAYKTGKGSIKVRAKVHVEQSDKRAKENLIVTELPYKVNKALLIQNIAQLVTNKKLDVITDLRDESDRTGLRIVIELKQGELPEVALNKLFKHTRLEERFHVQLLALDRNQPKLMNLKEILQAYVEHRRQVVVRRTIYDLNKAKDKAHILEGLKIALDNLDEIITVIRNSNDSDEANQQLQAGFGLTDEQAKAILAMRLSRLTGLERDKIISDLKETLAEIEYLEGILASDEKVFGLITDELDAIKDKYATARKTEISEAIQELTEEDLIADEEVVVSVTHANYMKRTPLNVYRSQRRGGRGVTAMAMKDDDFIEHLFIASNHDTLIIFTEQGQCYALRVFELPEGSRIAKGMAIVNLLQIDKSDNVAGLMTIREFSKDKSIILSTEDGIVKRSSLYDYRNVSKHGLIAIKVKEGDKVIDVDLLENNEDIFLCSRKGKGIRFAADDIKRQGRNTQGVIGMRLDDDDQVVGMCVMKENSYLLTVSENGYGKRTEVENFRRQNRAGKGCLAMKLTKKTGKLIRMKEITDDDELVFITNEGILLRTKANQISVFGRATQGVKLISPKRNTKVASVARIPRTEEGDV